MKNSPTLLLALILLSILYSCDGSIDPNFEIDLSQQLWRINHYESIDNEREITHYSTFEYENSLLTQHINYVVNPDNETLFEMNRKHVYAYPNDTTLIISSYNQNEILYRNQNVVYQEDQIKSIQINFLLSNIELFYSYQYDEEELLDKISVKRTFLNVEENDQFLVSRDIHKNISAVSSINNAIKFEFTPSDVLNPKRSNHFLAIDINSSYNIPVPDFFFKYLNQSITIKDNNIPIVQNEYIYEKNHRALPILVANQNSDSQHEYIYYPTRFIQAD